MNWLELLAGVEEYYRWRREHHPPYPDLLLEWGLYHDLLGRLREERGESGEEALAVAEAALVELLAQDRRFGDLRLWEAWREATAAPAPDGAALAGLFRRGMDLAGEPVIDALLEEITPLDEAPAALRQAAACPAFQRLFSAMGEVFTHRGEGEVGRKLYAWAALCGGRPARHWVYHARWARLRADGDQALATLNEGLARFPDDVEIMRALAEERDRAGDLSGAVALLERAVARQPDWPDLRYELARLHAEAEHTEESLLHIGRALELNPGYTRAAITRAELLLASGEQDAAQAQLEELRERDVESARIYELLSAIFAERRDPRRAERYSLLARQLRESEETGSSSEA
jgi:Flp pilus assembly protein TadD